MMMNPKWNMIFSRLLPYWLTVIATCWTYFYFCIWNTIRLSNWWEKATNKVFFAIEDPIAIKWSARLLGFMTPLLLAASTVTLLLTDTKLPVRRLSWFIKVIGQIRRFHIVDAEYGVALHKKNQFGVGQPDFNLISFWLVFLTGLILFIPAIRENLKKAHDPDKLDEDETARKKSVEAISYLAGWVGTVLMSFFLIPVSRHSVLLVAMNWSPVHALRIHIWAGYTAFFFIFLHGIMIVGVWFKWAPGAIYEEFIPSNECWKGTFSKDSAESRCGWQIYNFTGSIAFIFLAMLWVSSLEWFRRKWYRVFYILHVVFGTLTLLCSIWHFEFIGLYWLPSILYYLASTMPTLVQALASRFRGGIKISQVVVLDDAGSCIEIRASIDTTAYANLASTHSSKYIKLCAPSISAVWHPFTVYHHPSDPTSVRMLFRPVGPFTKALRSTLTGSTKTPIVLIDAFYRGSDHSQQAVMCHDHVSVIAGGVAITPFISMLFAVLNELTNKGSLGQGSPVLQSMTVIWSCREFGLLAFMKRSYLDDMIRLANSIDNFRLNIKIYYTGESTFADAEPLQIEKIIQGQTFSEKEESEMSVTVEDEVLTDPSDENDEAVMSGRWRKGKNVQHRIVSFETRKSGHSLELGRMMPARHKSVIWNIPYFLTFTTSIWLGFHFMFYPYDHVRSYRDYSEQTYITILVTLFYIGVGCVIECNVLLFRKYWPIPKDNHINHLPSARKMEEQIEVSETDEMVGDLSVDAVSYYIGRPGPDDMLADASLATAPGLFVCGPVGMVKMLRVAAASENKPFRLLTRYAIYEESFAM